MVDSAGLSKRYGVSQPFFDNEHPQHQVSLNSFYIDRFEVQNAHYRQYLIDKGIAPPRYWIENTYVFSMRPQKTKMLNLQKLSHLVSLTFSESLPDPLTKASALELLDKHWAYLDTLPIEQVTWKQAKQYCQSIGKRLPSESEWEKAARGHEGRQFPWGETWHQGNANTGEEHWPFKLAPVGSYVKDKSPFGVFDMAGNAYEWVADWYLPYPNSDVNDPYFGKKHKVVRGSGYGGVHYALDIFERGSFRGHLHPDDAKPGMGFRCAKNAN